MTAQSSSGPHFIVSSVLQVASSVAYGSCDTEVSLLSDSLVFYIFNRSCNRLVGSGGLEFLHYREDEHCRN